MWLKQNANVITPAGDKVGEIDRVVMDPNTHEITHVVIRKGFLFREDKVLPIQYLEKSGQEEDEVRLKPGVDDLEGFPPFEEEDYLIADETELRDTPFREEDSYASPLYWISSGSWMPVYGPYYWNASQSVEADEAIERITRTNIPAGTVAVKEGADVLSSDGKHVGTLKQVLMQPGTEKASHFVIRQGTLFTEDRLVPLKWIQFVGEDQIHLSVNAQFLESLPAYED